MKRKFQQPGATIETIALAIHRETLQNWRRRTVIFIGRVRDYLLSRFDAIMKSETPGAEYLRQADQNKLRDTMTTYANDDMKKALYVGNNAFSTQITLLVKQAELTFFSNIGQLLGIQHLWHDRFIKVFESENQCALYIAWHARETQFKSWAIVQYGDAPASKNKAISAFRQSEVGVCNKVGEDVCNSLQKVQGGLRNLKSVKMNFFSNRFSVNGASRYAIEKAAKNNKCQNRPLPQYDRCNLNDVLQAMSLSAAYSEMAVYRFTQNVFGTIYAALLPLTEQLTGVKNDKIQKEEEARIMRISEDQRTERANLEACQDALSGFPQLRV